LVVTRSSTAFFAAFILVALLPVFANEKPRVYFDLGAELTEQFHGTYEFKHKQVEFVRQPDGSYIVKSSGDQSPSTDELVTTDGYVYWILGHSGEKWIKLKVAPKDGDEWHNRLRGWNQRYRVLATDATVTVPAGTFQHCARVEVSWIAQEHDMSGSQKIVFYLAPRLGIIKREEWSDGQKWHEEVLTTYTGTVTGDKSPLHK
jgi:hypothetical protein